MLNNFNKKMFPSFSDGVMSWPPNNRSGAQQPTATSSDIDNAGTSHRWCPVNNDNNKTSCSGSGGGHPSTAPRFPLQENVIESTSALTDPGVLSDTDSGLGVHEACENLVAMPGPPTRGRKGGKDTPRTPIDNPVWQVQGAEGAPAATTSSELPGAVSRTDNARASLPMPGTSSGSGGAVLHSLRDPSHYEELSVIGNGKKIKTKQHFNI